MPPRLKVSATPLRSDLDVPSKSDNIGTHSADLKSYEISNTLVPRTGHTNQSHYISALSKIAPADCKAGTVAHPKQLEYWPWMRCTDFQTTSAESGQQMSQSVS
jgi:hypothetical protein